MTNDELVEARSLAIAGWVAASSLEAAEVGNGSTIEERDLCIPNEAPEWLLEGIKACVGGHVSDIPIGKDGHAW